MPFGLKNARVTYQRLVNKMLTDFLRKIMEVYIDDMLVKSAEASDFVHHLEECFKVLRKHNMKLNPTKYSFGVAYEKFIGYLVTKRGIQESTQPRSLKDI